MCYLYLFLKYYMRTTEPSQKFIKKISHWILSSFEGEGVTWTFIKIYRDCVWVKKMKRYVLLTIFSHHVTEPTFFLLNVLMWFCDCSRKRSISISTLDYGGTLDKWQWPEKPKRWTWTSCIYNFKNAMSYWGIKFWKLLYRYQLGPGYKKKWSFAKSPKTAWASSW